VRREEKVSPATAAKSDRIDVLGFKEQRQSPFTIRFELPPSNPLIQATDTLTTTSKLSYKYSLSETLS